MHTKSDRPQSGHSIYSARPTSLHPPTMNTSTMYKWVVDDVIAKCKPEAVQEGLDEWVVTGLRGCPCCCCWWCGGGGGDSDEGGGSSATKAKRERSACPHRVLYLCWRG